MLEGKQHSQHLGGTVKGLAAEDVPLHRVTGQLAFLVAAGEEAGTVEFPCGGVAKASLEGDPAAVS